MSFWDGSRWVSESPPAEQAKRTPWRDWAATLGMIVVVVAFSLPFASTEAGTPSISTSPSSGMAGTSVAVVGRNFPARTRVQLTWDGSLSGLPSANVNGRGAFKATMRVPADSVGPHALGAEGAAPKGSAPKGAAPKASAASTTVIATPDPELIASTVFTVTDADTSTPTPDPTTQPTREPTAAPTTAPAATPTQAPATTPTPPAAATPDPTPPPTPAPTPTALPTPTTQPTPPDTTAIYGPAIGIDGIGNLQIGGPNGAPTRQVAYRFRATTSAALTRIQFTQTDGSGYWGGTGGSLSITVQSDAGGNPSGAVLAAASFVPADLCCYWPVLAFPSPPTLVAGHVYHIVFRNTDPSPATNYTSLNNHFLSAMETPLLPKYPDSDWRTLVRETTGGSWYDPRPDGSGTYVAQLALSYADGTVGGIAYPYVGPSYSLASGVRERFSSTTSRSVTSLGLRLNGSGTVRLETGGTTIGTAAFSASGRWISVPLAATLAAGQTYDLVVTGSGSIRSMYEGSAYGDWPEQTYFSDGAIVGHSDQDLPFYLR
jgi:hypothetical protein